MKSLRDLLYHLKNDYYEKNNPIEYEVRNQKCKEELFDCVSDNIEYFKKFNCNLNDILFCVSVYQFSKRTPSEICELAKRFNDSATGLYGRHFDNQTSLIFEDQFGNCYKMLALSPKYYSVNNYEFNIYTMNGQHLLYKFVEQSDKFSNEHIAELEKMYDYERQYYKSVERDKERYAEIKQYKDYIKIEHVSTGYAHCVKNVTVDKKIPIKLSHTEIAKYADSWNYCFGGEVSVIEDNDEYTKYKVRINTD